MVTIIPDCGATCDSRDTDIKLFKSNKSEG